MPYVSMNDLLALLPAGLAKTKGVGECIYIPIIIEGFGG